uniref:DUF4283 domain-containing protein n=1 Tax=Noccaea caerulescens TaxID=107243 RepID=A0A1J3E2N4_NOCCA
MNHGQDSVEKTVILWHIWFLEGRSHQISFSQLELYLVFWGISLRSNGYGSWSELRNGRNGGSPFWKGSIDSFPDWLGFGKRNRSWIWIEASFSGLIGAVLVLPCGTPISVSVMIGVGSFCLSAEGFLLVLKSVDTAITDSLFVVILVIGVHQSYISVRIYEGFSVKFAIEEFIMDSLCGARETFGDSWLERWISFPHLMAVAFSVRERSQFPEDWRKSLWELCSLILGPNQGLEKQDLAGFMLKLESRMIRELMRVDQDLRIWRDSHIHYEGSQIFLMDSTLMVKIGQRDINRLPVDGCSSHYRSRPLLQLLFLVPFFLLSKARDMSQANGLKSGGSDKGKEVLKPRLKITVPRFDNTELIRGYSNTLIGRCMNPQMQDMNTLLYMLPRIWKTEGRVAGADLGMGRFQFDFDSEEDLNEVLKMEPYHFDYWMLSVVRWQPVVEANYPSAITFWVRMMGIPLHFWAEPTFRSIGEALGEVKAVDIDGGRVQICLDGFKPLILDTTVEFHSGEETTVTLMYERLVGFCRECLSLCHDRSCCPMLKGKREVHEAINRRDERPTLGLASYKGVVIHGAKETKGEGFQSHVQYREDPKGKGRVVDQKWQKYGVGRGKNGYGGDGFSYGRANAGPAPPREMRKRVGGTSCASNSAVEEHYDEAFKIREKRLEGMTVRGERTSRSPSQPSAKKVRKALDFDETVMGLDELGNRIEEVAIITSDPAEVSEKDQTIMIDQVAPETEALVEATQWRSDAGDDTVTGVPEKEKLTCIVDSQVNEMQIDDVSQGISKERPLLPEVVEEMKADEVKGVLKGKQVGDRRPVAKKKLFRPTVGLAGGSLQRFVQAAKTPRKKVVSKALDMIGEQGIVKVANSGNPPAGSGSSEEIA